MPDTPPSLPSRSLPALADLFRQAPDADEPQLHSLAIDAAVVATGSEIGYFHLVNEDQETIELGTWSAGTLSQCQAVYQRHYPISQAGVWADCARQRRPLIHNDYPSLPNRRGYPSGHVPLYRHLGVPVLEGDQVVLLVGVGNKASEYDDEDLASVQLIADSAWRLIRQHRRKLVLESAERQLAEIQKMAVISLWEWDPEDRRLHCDGNMGGLFGLDALGDVPCSPEGLMRFVDPRNHAALQDLFYTSGPGTVFDLEVRAFRIDGVALALHLRGAAHPRSQGHGIVLRGFIQDVTERLELGRIRYNASHDALTGLSNRSSLIGHLEALLRNSRRNPQDLFAVHYIDLDHFKPVNDRWGHAVGDLVLKLVAERLLLATRKDDFVARLGGDELIVVQRHATGGTSVDALAAKIIAILQQPMEIEGHRFAIGASIGAALACPQSETAEDILVRADRAMYQAKAKGRGGYCLA